jgi:serine protease Do
MGVWSKVMWAAALAAAAGYAQLPANAVRLQGPPQPVTGSYLGVWVWEVDQARAAELKLPEAGGVEVTRVREGSPAADAGLRPGDVITKFNGQRVAGNDHFSRLVRETPVGQRVTLEVYRGGAPQMMTATVASAANLGPVPPLAGPRPGPAVPDLPRSMTTWRSPVLGVDAEALEGQLAEYFGAKQGVLVRSVTAGSPAEKAGIKAGDAILRVEGREVSTPADVTARLRALTGRTASLAILREHREITVSVVFDDERN